MKIFQLSAALFLSIAVVTPSHADTVSDALQAAMDAYAAGDLKAASTSVAAASAGIGALQSEKYAVFLPEAPEGWTREATPDFATSLTMMGGGSGAEMRYANPEGNAFSISIIADNPMVSGMLGLVGNDALLATVGKVIEVDGAKIIDQDGSMVSVIGTNMMMQAGGLDSATMLPIVSAVDYKGLAALSE